MNFTFYINRRKNVRNSSLFLKEILLPGIKQNHEVYFQRTAGEMFTGILIGKRPDEKVAHVKIPQRRICNCKLKHFSLCIERAGSARGHGRVGIDGYAFQ